MDFTGNRVDWVLRQNGWSKREMSAITGIGADKINEMMEDISNTAPCHLPKINKHLRDRPYSTRQMKTIRNKSGMTQGELADELGVSSDTIQKIEGGSMPTCYEKVVKHLESLDADSSVYTLMDYVASGWVVETVGWNLERLKDYAENQAVGPKQAIYRFPPGEDPKEKGHRYLNSELERKPGEFVYTCAAKKSETMHWMGSRG